MSYKQSLIAVALCVAAMWMIPGAVLAQNPPPGAPPGVVSITNQYIEYVFGESGQFTYGNIAYDITGRFGVVSKIGDPETTDDDNLGLVAMVAATYPIINSLRVRVGANTSVVGNNGSWTKTPQAYVQPAAGQAKGVTGPYMEAEWTTTAGANVGAVAVGIVAHLVRDQVRMQITLTNRGANAQSVGLAVFSVPTPTGAMGIAFPFVPGVGQVLASGSGPQFYGQVLSGQKIPASLEAFSVVTNPTRVVRYTLRLQDCTVPDYVGIGDYGDLLTPAVRLPAGYVPDPIVPVDTLSVLLEWAQRTLAPGASRKIVTYYGVGAASSAWTHGSTRDHVVLAVQGPRAAKYDTLNSTGLTPDTFKIKAYVYNLDTDPGPYDLKDVSAYLFLPNGLELDPSSSAQQQIGPVPINSEAAPVEWTVRATGDYVGELQYYVTAKDTSGWQQIVSRKIMVPAVKHTVVTGGFQMVSVPFAANNPSPEHLFRWSSGSFFAKYYDPSGLGSYKSVIAVEPGQGFWLLPYILKAGETMPVQLADDAQIAGENSGHQLDLIQLELKQGWNMIGNPYVYPIYLGQLMVWNKTTNTTINFDDAVANNWISRTIFQWNSSKGTYEYLKGNDAYLLPWKGYWVRASVPGTLIFRPAAWPGSGVLAQPGGF